MTNDVMTRYRNNHDASFHIIDAYCFLLRAPRGLLLGWFIINIRSNHVVYNFSLPFVSLRFYLQIPPMGQIEYYGCSQLGTVCSFSLVTPQRRSLLGRHYDKHMSYPPDSQYRALVPWRPQRQNFAGALPRWSKNFVTLGTTSIYY